MLSHCVIVILILFTFNISCKGTDKVRNCKNKICIPKCCPSNNYVGKKKICQPYNGTYEGNLNFSDVIVYNKKLKNSDKHIYDIFKTVPNAFSNTTFKRIAYDLSRVGFRMYLREDGVIILDVPNAYIRWREINSEHFCVDYLIPRDNSTKISPRFWVIMESDEPPQSNVYLTSSIMISCVFLAIVFIVYSILPELRNLCGMILMAYVASLFFTFLLLAVIQMKKHPPEACIGLTISIYFFFLASFCWMSIMSYDIWWTFRGYAKARPIHRRGERFKFLMYGLCAWGLPFAMAITIYILNNSDMSDYPWLITPKIPRNGCFLEGGEKLLYLYMPMLILIICNWMFYMMTAFNIWRLSRGTSVLDTAAAGSPAAHRTHRQRFMVYLKLSVVMGLNWVLEVVSFVMPGLRIWYLTDYYNIFIGLAIFLIFVCKMKIYRKLCKALRRTKKPRGTPSSKSASSSTTDSNASQETTLPICANPKGPGMVMKSF